LLGGIWPIFPIIFLSLRVTGIALAICTVAGVPIGAILGLTRIPGRRLVTAILYTGMGLPPVVVGLFVYLLLSRSGPLGALGWLFTPRAMILAQAVISFPLVTGLTMTAIQSVDPSFRQQMRALGATRLQEIWALLREARLGVVAGIVAAFGSIISEVGAVMLVGGNIAGKTRVRPPPSCSTPARASSSPPSSELILLALAFLANLAMRVQRPLRMSTAFRLEAVRQRYAGRTVLDLKPWKCVGEILAWWAPARQVHLPAPAELPGAADGRKDLATKATDGSARRWSCAAR
jgi:tungstate transport system permease protein